MPDIKLEPVVVAQTSGQGGQLRRVHLLHPFAEPADQMDVLRLVDIVVGGSTVREVHVRHQTQLCEQLERAIDGGDVDPGRVFEDRGVDLFRSGVAEPAHRIEDQLALRGQPQPTVAQEVG